jgi:hypothetical protein
MPKMQMAAKPIVKKSHAKRGAVPQKAGPKAAVVGFQAQDNEDSTYTVFGVDAAGAQVDISGIASMTISGGQPPSVTNDPPQGMTALFHFAPPPTNGPVNFTVEVTWNDGSVGPFTIDQPVTVTAGQVTGVIGTFGTPVIRP